MKENKFRENLVAYRKAAGLSQKALAEKLSIPLTTLAGYENAGRDPKISTLIKLADFFGVSIDRLIRGSKDDMAYKIVGDKVQLHIPDNISREGLKARLDFYNQLLQLADESVRKFNLPNQDLSLDISVNPKES